MSINIPHIVPYPEYIYNLLESLNTLYEKRLIRKSIINRVNMLVKKVAKYELQERDKLKENNIRKLLEYEINLKLILHL